MVYPAPYLGKKRGLAILELITRIKALSPDVVGLCEVFDNDERDLIWKSVKDTHPFSHQGPFKIDPFSDGGCLLLTKHPVLSKTQLVYSYAVGDDKWSNKGVLHMRIQTPTAPRPYEIFYSHAQNIEEEGGKEALYHQMGQMGVLISQVAHPNNPIFIMGDLNIPGEVPQHHREMISRLTNPVDLWLVGGGSPDGFTFVEENSFYKNGWTNPKLNRRVDYILMRAPEIFTPILKHMEILKFKVEGRDFSDHFGLRASFEQSVQVTF
jgi:endonuclease/exonuclease/phosphatase family metal-dependent hydrolase